MFDGLKPYPGYSTGHLGSLPVGWGVPRFRGVGRMLVSTVDKHTHENEATVRLCNYVDVYKNDYITNGLVFMRATATATEIRQFRINRDDVLITKDSESFADIGVPAYVVEEAEDLVCGYHLAILRTQKDVLGGAYFFRALQVAAIAHQLHVAAGGVTRFGLSHDDIKSVRVPVPPLDDQRAIVRYLAHANARIDRAIAAKRKLIALLEEQTRSISHDVVVHGVQSDPELRDSGIRWLGSIPSHWRTPALRRVARVLSGSTPSRAEARYWSPGVIPWVSSGKVNERRIKTPSELISTAALAECSLEMVPIGSVVVGLVGQGRTRGLSAILEISACPNQNLAALVSGELILSDFLLATLTAAYSELRSLGRGGNQAALNGGILGSFQIPLPPIEEQRKILGHVERATASAAKGLSMARREIVLLREFRSRLTADVVTGQVDVRAIAATWPDIDLKTQPTEAGAGADDADGSIEEFLEEVDA